MHAHVGTVQLGLWLASGLEQDVQKELGIFQSITY